MPKFRDKVFRPDAVRVKYFDKNMNEQIIEADGLLQSIAARNRPPQRYLLLRPTLCRRKTLAQGKLRKIMRGDIIPDYEYMLGES